MPRKRTPKTREYFDADAASRAIDFFPDVLRHSKGRWAGQPFRLEEWQKKIVADIFGWKRPDGTRKYREAYVEIPRKNGKTTVAAGAGNLLTFCDDEAAAEVYALASDKEQAKMVFSEAKRMVVASPLLMERATVLKDAIVVPETLSSWKVLSADADNKHGFNTHGCVIDELHAQPDRDLYDVMATSVGSRTQPLMLMLTTAGYDTESICYEKHEYALQVARGEIVDPDFYGVIFAADPEDDWTSPKTWAKANPNLGVSLGLDYIESACRKAINSPASENTFKRLHLNIWTSQATKFLSMSAWDKGKREPGPIAGRRCYGGLDLSSRVDLTAGVRVFPCDDGSFDIYPTFWIPEQQIDERSRRDKVPYRQWVARGFLKTTPGSTIDFEFIRHEVRGWADECELVQVGFDKWNAKHLGDLLEADGVNMIEVRQGFQSLSEPTKALEALVLDEKIRHGGHPLLRWCADNVQVLSDPNANLRPCKKSSKKRIDGIVALIMALSRAILSAEQPSVYETRGLAEV